MDTNSFCAGSLDSGQIRIMDIRLSNHNAINIPTKCPSFSTELWTFDVKNNSVHQLSSLGHYLVHDLRQTDKPVRSVQLPALAKGSKHFKIRVG